MLHLRVGWPASVIVDIPVLLWWLLATTVRYDCFVHSLDAPAHGVGSRGKEVVEWPGFGTIRTGVEVIDVTTVGVTVIHVCEAFDGIRRCYLSGRWSCREMLIVVASTSSAATASASVVRVVVVAWCVVLHGWVHRWACHDCVAHLLEVG